MLFICCIKYKYTSQYTKLLLLGFLLLLPKMRFNVPRPFTFSLFVVLLSSICSSSYSYIQNDRREKRQVVVLCIVEESHPLHFIFGMVFDVYHTIPSIYTCLFSTPIKLSRQKERKPGTRNPFLLFTVLPLECSSILYR